MQPIGYFVLVVTTLLLLRELIFRFFFIYPKTDYTGRYAALIEERFIPRWVIAELKSGAPREIIFLGNSHLMDAIDPATVERKTGRRSYNVALYGLPSQYCLELIIRHKYFPKLLFVDFSTRYSTYQRNNDYVRSLTTYWNNPPKWKIFLLEAIDRAHFLLPSIFLPIEYFFLTKRTWKKVVEYRRKGVPTLGRYTPFRLLASYSWTLDKLTNHRIVKRERSVTNVEARFEEYLLTKSIAETNNLCNPGTGEYDRSMADTASMLREIRNNGTQIVLLRLPLHPKFIEFENLNCGKFFRDLSKLAEENALAFLDLSEPLHLTNIGSVQFYGDGQHVDHNSAKKISNYIGELIINKYYKHIF